MRRISVGDVMTRGVMTARPQDSLYNCAKIMTKKRVNSIFITVNSSKLVGMLTARDILWALTKKPSLDLRKTKCIDFATRKLAVVKPSAEISQALEKMKALNFRRLPVLSKGELIGVVTLKDILAVEPKLYEEIKDSLEEVRESERKLKEAGREWPLEGICNNCGAFSELLKVEGLLLCPDCREELY